MRLCVVAHYGLGGHRGVQATLASLKRFFEWKGMQADVDKFVSNCLHCNGAAGCVKRPYGEAPHATKPSELIHWDYLSMGDGYLFVVKDDATNFIALYPTERADARQTARFLMNWFGVHGPCYEWVSDQGSHFKNEVIAELQHVMGAKHHFMVARCPWANGTVENAMKHVLKAFRALLSEWRMDPKDWPLLSDVVQLICNQSPAPSLGGLAPIEAMMGRAPLPPLALIAVPESNKSTTMEEIMRLRGQEIIEMRNALQIIHQSVAISKSRKREASKVKRNEKARLENFEVGDYVLYLDVYHVNRKLKGQWKGPAQIVKVLSAWVYEIQHLLTAKVREVHASRIKFYADKSLLVTEELKNHVAYNDQGYEVEAFRTCRWNADQKKFEVQVKWRGLEEVDMTWEPAVNLMEDLPQAFEKFIRANANNVTIDQMRKAHGWEFVPRKGGSVASKPKMPSRSPSSTKASPTRKSKRILKRLKSNRNVGQNPPIQEAVV